MSLYDLLSKEQLTVNVRLGKNVGTVFDLSYLLVDFQSVVNGLTELISDRKQSAVYETAAQRIYQYEVSDKDTHPKATQMHPDWQREIESGLASILYPDKFNKRTADISPAAGYKKTTSRRFNKKYRTNLKLCNFQKGSLLLNIVTPVVAGLILEFIKELIFQKTGKRDVLQINIQNTYISINGSDIESISKDSCISNAVVIKDEAGAKAIDTKAMIDHVIRSAKPDDNIEESVKRFLTVLEDNRIIYQSETYDKRGMKTFVKDTERFIGNLIDVKA